MKQSHQVFSDAFRLKVAREYLETELSQKELLQKYKIGGKGCITTWVRKFGLMPEPAVKRENGYPNNYMKKGKENRLEEKRLERKVKELERQFEYEKLRSDALDTVIRIAEDKFKIAIRKKSGTKQ